MRRSILASVPDRLAYAAVIAASSFALMACEDGPNQTYSPAPNGAGDNWNGYQDAGSATDPSRKDFSQPQTGQNKQVLCTGSEKAKMWGWALQQDITPPSGGGGLDLSGGPTWVGLTVEKAETPVRDSKGALIIPPPPGGGLCQGDAQGDLFGDGNQVITWGDNAELWMHYLVSNRKGSFLVFYQGYLGSLKAKSRAGGRFGDHTYEIPLSRQVTKDGTGFKGSLTGVEGLDWYGPKGPNDWRNELHDALLATFAPGLPPSDDCYAEGRCIQGSFGDVAYFYIPALGHATWVAHQAAGQPTASIPNRVDGDLAKVTPFAFASPLLKIDAEGPTATAGTLGMATAPCNLKFGLTYGDFLSTCVQVSGNTTTDTDELNKLIGGLRHSAERFSFNITGVDINFTDATLANDKVVGDSDKPSNDDVSTRFTVDQSALGKIANDYVGNSTNNAQDLHGSGLVYLEYARLVQQELNKLTGGTHPLGDPLCMTDVATQRSRGCTGFEGVITAAPKASVSDVNMQNDAFGFAAHGFGIGGMKPGHHTIVFCDDPTRTCATIDPKAKGDTFPVSFARVLDVLGHGLVANLPVEARDARFFFKQYFTALVKYLKAAGNPPTGFGPGATLDQVHSIPIDPYNLFFDSIGAGQFEIAEYVDRSAVTATTDPVDIVFEADVKNGIMDAYDFSRDLLRGETAMYASMIDHRDSAHPDDPPGFQNTALLTNMFGSPVLLAGWKDHTIMGTGGGMDTVTPAYYCATTWPPDTTPGHCCDLDTSIMPPNPPKCLPGTAQTAPYTGSLAIGPCTTPNVPAGCASPILDEGGNKLLSHYEGAFGTARTAWTLGATPIKILNTYPNIQSAMIKVPLHVNPYNLASNAAPAGDSLSVLVPWAPKQPGIGFPVALTGTRDKFVETYQLELSGNTITANIDYDYPVDPSTHKVATDATNFLAVETTDFLGEVFICQDPLTKDLLTARMYTSVSTILDWFTSHPGAYQACTMIIRYSPYGNYADYVTSNVAGVRLGITQGGGYGRVVDGTLYDPTLATSQ